MANQTTTSAVNAFLAGKPGKFNNTEVTVYDGIVSLVLHSSPIAWYGIGSSALTISAAGYTTHTTKERLNGLPGVRVHQKNWEWFLNDERWGGEPIILSNVL